MKTLGSFRYQVPGSMQEIMMLLDDNKTRCRVLAGGTDLLVMLRNGTIQTDLVVDIKGIQALHKIQWNESDGMRIGAACTITQLWNSDLIRKYVPVFLEVIKTFANMQVRNRATIGGNITRSSPAGDLLPVLLALDAKVRLVSRGSERTLPLEGFFTGPGQNIMEANELLAEVIIPPVDRKRAVAVFHKVMRTADDLAKINVAVYLEVENGKIQKTRVAVGSVAPIPKRLNKVEAFLQGADISEELLDEATRYVKEEIAPISDVRSTKEYRSQITGIFVKRTLQKALRGVKQ